LTYVVLATVSAVFVAPFLWMVSTSLKPDSQIFTPTVNWMPRPVLWGNYPAALASFPFWLYLRNTLWVCFMATLGTVLSAALPAYGFARLRWRGRDVLFLVLICTIMLPAQVTMIPVFLTFRALGWTGPFLPLIVPPFLGSAFSIFLLRQFFLTIPQELSDAAKIDGCSELAILWRVVMPMAKPAVATIALFAFTAAWMDFLNPLVYLHDETQYTLAIGLQAFLGRHGSEWALLMAAATVITIPMLVLFLLAQRTFIRGIALTGLKG
jgi:multiple sugar transport system permease protein